MVFTMLLLVKCFDIKKVLLMWRDQLNFAPQGEQTKKNEKTKKNVKREVMYQK